MKNRLLIKFCTISFHSDQYKLVDDILRERLHNELKSKDVPEKFTIKSSERIRIRNSGELYIKCNCECKFCVHKSSIKKNSIQFSAVKSGNSLWTQPPHTPSNSMTNWCKFLVFKMNISFSYLIICSYVWRFKVYINRLIKKISDKITANSNGFWLRIGTIVVVTLSLRGQSEVKFLGYVTGTERNNELLKFEMIVASDYVDDLSRPSIVKIDASCNVQKLMKAYDAIHTAQKSNLLHGIINPKCFIPNGQRRGKWVVSPLFNLCLLSS